MVPGCDILVTSYSLPKQGAHTQNENEDAVAVAVDAGIACVSDGASSSYRSADWSRHLVGEFVGRRPDLTPESITAWALIAADSFRAGVGPSDDAGWWDEAASTRGAFATFTALVVRQEPYGLRWQGVAVGDSVILHLRSEADGFRLVSGFPLEVSAAFAGSPQLLGSTAVSAIDLPSVRFVEGAAQPDDVFLVATDETARWALASAEQGYPVWNLLVRGTDDDKTSAIVSLRATGALVNDDMTVLVVRPSA